MNNLKVYTFEATKMHSQTVYRLEGIVAYSHKAAWLLAAEEAERCGTHSTKSIVLIEYRDAKVSDLKLED